MAGQELNPIIVPTDSIPPKPVDRFFKESHDSTLFLSSIPIPPKSVTPSFFTHSLLKTDHLQPKPISNHQPDWMLGLFILWIGLLSWTRYFYGKRVQHIFASPFSRRAQNQLLREGDLFSERLTLALGITYFLGMTFLFYQVHGYLFNYAIPSPFTPVTLYLFFLGALIAYWFVKILLMLFLGSVFKTKTTTQEYLINLIVINGMSGFLLLPIVLAIVYLHSHLAIQIAIIFVAFLFILRFVKGFLTGLTLTKFSYIFLFVYLCALEIVPLILVIKISLIYYISKVPVH